MKVGIVFGGGDEGGGPAYLRNFFDGFDAGRIECVYISLGRDTLGDEFKEQMAAVEKLEGLYGSFMQAALGVSKIVKEHGIEVLHTHGLRANFAGRVAGAMTSTPVVTTVHSVISTDYASSLKGTIAEKLDNLTFGWTTTFIAVSNSIKNDLIRRGARPERVVVVYNGVSPVRSADRSAVRAELGLGPEDFVVGTVARLEKNKGVANLIRAARELKPAIERLKVAVVGDGNERKNLEDESARLGLSETIAFLGERKDVRELMRAFDVLSVPSLSEGFGLVAVEGMEARLPVVASRVGGLVEILEDGINGLLVPPGDPRSLAEAVSSLYRSPDLRSRLAARAHMDYRARFMIERFVEETTRVLEEAANNP